MTENATAPAGLADLYIDLHRLPELSFQEERTAAMAAAELSRLGFEVTAGVGRTGVVGVLGNGPGPTILLRADMDALPVREATGLAYASTVRGRDAEGQDVPVMHACGHDVHVTCLVGAARVLASERETWTGTLVVVFQPAEELGVGARTMIEDGLFERFPVPEVVLGQHVAPFPAGLIGIRDGVAFAGSDSLRVTLYGTGGHGSRPETTVDPVVMAAATVLRLQTVVSRELGAMESAVVTVGSMLAGTKENIIPDTAELGLSVRTFDPGVRERTLEAIRRFVAGEAATSGAPRAPDVRLVTSFPPVVNSVAAVGRVREALGREFGAERLIEPGPVTGSEDVGLLATAAGAECAFWLLGGEDPALFANARSPQDVMEVVRGLPSNHSPEFAPAIEPTLSVGVTALVAAAREWLRAAT
jgi:hippurate hydrolase